LGNLSETFATVMINATFRRLFGGLALTPDQEASARDVITRAQQEMPVPAPPRAVHLRVNRFTGLVAMAAESDSTLAALVRTDAERATLRARIVSIRQ
jgi:hypothetical protein